MNQGNKQKQTMRGILSLAIMFGIGLLLFSYSAQATTGINKQINFQGKVTNTDGTNVANGSYTFLFCIYTVSSPSSACTSGADNDAVWRESKSITVTDGVFQTNLGDTTAFASLIDFNTDNIYLGINFNANGQMTPLVRFTASPYAMNAGKVAGLTVTDTTGTLTIPAGKTISFADAFSTSGAFATTLTSTAITNATLPSGTITLADLATSQTLTNKIIGSTGLTFTGATTDIDTAAAEALVLQGRAASSFVTTSGAITLAAAGSGTTSVVQIGAGGAGSTTPDYFGLDVKSDTGDPAGGFEGAMYYNTADNKFRCYQGGGWTDCIGSGGSTDLQTAYGNDPDTGDTTISLTSADDSLIISNPTSSGTDSAFALKVDQQHTTGAVSAMDIIQASNNANGVNLTANAIDTEIGLALTVNALTSGSAESISSSSTAFTGSLANITLSGSHAANTGSLLTLTNSGTLNTGTTLVIQHNATGTNNLAFRVNDIAADTTPFVIDGGGNVGIGTLAPVSPLEIYGSGADIVSTITVADATYDPILKFRTGASPSIQFSLGVDNSDSGKFKIFSGDGLGSGDEFTIDSNGVTTIANLNLGSTTFDTDAGAVTWVDMPVTASATINTVESYTAQIDGNSLLTVYAESDGAGSIQNSGVSIGNAALQAGAKFAVTQSSTSTTASSTLYGTYNSVTDTGVVTATGDNTYGNYTTVTRTGSTTAGTFNSYGNYITVTADNAGAATSNAYGEYVTVSGADNNYSGVFMGGNFGIGDATPLALFTVGASDAFQVNTTGTVSIATGQSYTGVGTVTLSSGGSSGLTLDSASGRVSVATGDFLALGVAGVAGATAGDIWYDTTANKYKINENGTTKTLCNITDAGCGSGGTSDLQATYGNDANGSDATIALTTADDSIIISNPASSGTDSAFALKVEQLAAGAIDGLQITNAGTGNGLKINATGTGNLALFQNNGVDKVTFANNGSMTINGADSSVVRDNSTEFALGTVGSNLINANSRIEMSDGTPASNVGAINTTSQPIVNAAIGAGAMSISRPNGKYFVINGGGTLTTSIYDPVLNTITAGNPIITSTATGIGLGAILLPRANGMYVLITGHASSTNVNATANIDPSGAVPNTTGPSLATNNITVAGTVAFKRPDGKYLVTVGGGVTTQIYDPVANTFALGPPATGMGNFGAGVLAIPRPDGTALIVSGGNASTTAIYSPYAGSATIGSFILAQGLGFGPKLDGIQAAGTCGVNGGSVAIKRQDGQFLILSKGGAGAAAVSALYDPVGNTMTCRTSKGPSANLGDGAHAIPLQNGKFLIYAGGNTTTAFVYSQDTDTFADWSGTAPVAITAGAHSILRPDGTWQTITGTNTCGSSTGCTFNYSTNLPMSDPFPSQVMAGTPTSSGSCTAGTHSYYVTFYNGSTESELSNKSNIVSCTAGNGTVALTSIPIGPFGTTARRIYRTPTGDVGAPQLVGSGSCVLSDNSTTTCSDTLADGSLGSAYSVTAATTWYTTEDISSTALSPSSTLRWNAQLEAVYAANQNAGTNTAFKVMQFFVKTAVNNSGCATPLLNAPWQEIQNSGDLIRASLGANCLKISVHFNRAMPKRLFDDRGVWVGNSNTLLRYDYVTPTLFSISVDNSAVLKRYAFDFSSPNSNDPVNATIPDAPTSAAPAGSGSCTSGNHFWFVTFVTNGKESLLSPASVVRSCSGSNIETLNPIPIGPSGTTARKIYRTKAADLVTDTPFYVGTVSDNSTTTFADSIADSSLGAAFASTTPSGPTLSRGESSRVEMVNNQLTLPWGRITPTTIVATVTGLGNFYMGAFGSDHPLLNNLTGIGTTVIARDDKTFLVVEAGNGTGTADLYDPVTQTFINQTGAGNVPTAGTASGSFAIKRPNGKFLLIMGTGITTTACTVSGTATNIYDQYAPPGSRFTNGPCLSATAGQGAFSIQNTDGTFTILHGNATTSTTIYDPVRNTMSPGPLQITGTNVGGLAIPLTGPMNNNYKIIVGTTLGGAVGTATMNYNANTKIFTGGTVLAVGSGSGAFAFQRQDGFWILVKAGNTSTTSIINPYNGVELAGVALNTSVADRGSHVIPRADGTFLIVGGNAVSGVAVTTNIYFPWGGIWNATVGANQGIFQVGPTMNLPGSGAVPAAPTSGAPTAGGSCTVGAHFWKYSFVTQGIESPLSTVSTTQTCVLTTGQTETLTVPTLAAPTGTTTRRIYRTLAGAAATAPYYYIGAIADNSTTTFADTFADPAATNPYNGGGVGDGALSFQRPDGKWITIFGGSTPSKTTNIYDAGWYSDGQYMSEQMNVTPMAANSTLDWQQTPDQYVRMEVRSASSQTALSVAGSNIVSKPGGSIGNAANDNWVQVTVNFRRDFPTFGGNLNGVYNSTGGMTYNFRQISMPTVNSFQITNGMDLMTLQNNGLNVLRVTSNGNIMSSTGGGFFSGGADLAENYTSTQALDKGEVVMVDRTNPEAVLRSTGQYEKNMLGVVSTAPGFVAGGYTQDSYPIALVGRVPVKISTENGPIMAGDYLTAASIPGYAMRATQAGRVLGKALESFDTEKAVTCPSQGLGNAPLTQCGSVMMFVNLTDYFGMPVDVVMAEQTDNMNGVDGLSSNPITTEKNGLETPSNIRLAISAPAKERQTLGYLMKLRDARSSGSTMPASELFTDRISASTSVTTPTLVADQIFARSIQAESIEGLSIWTDQLQSLSEKYAGLEAVQTTSSTTEANEQSVIEQKAFAVALKNISTDALTVQLDGSILGKLSVGGALRIGGDAQFDGDTIFSKLATFLGDTLFQGKVAFEQAPSFSSNTAGFAIIEEGAQSVTVIFDEPYVKQPIITVSIANNESPLVPGADKDLEKDIQAVEDDFTSAYFESDVKYIVTKKNTKGFTIVLSKKAPRELSFSWVAIAVNGAKTSYSEAKTMPVSVEVIAPPIPIETVTNSEQSIVPTGTPVKEVPQEEAVTPLVTLDSGSNTQIESPVTATAP